MRRLLAPSCFVLLTELLLGAPEPEPPKDSMAEHWSLGPLRSVAPPEVDYGDWVRTPVDRFVLARLENHGLSPAAPAGRARLLRRASFGLLGLAPDRRDVERFVSDDRPRAYERVVESLLASPHYGDAGVDTGSTWRASGRATDTKRTTNGPTPGRIAMRSSTRSTRTSVRSFRPLAARGRPVELDPPSRHGAHGVSRGGADGHERRRDRSRKGAVRQNGRRRIGDGLVVSCVDDRLCSLPRSQVRPDFRARLLSPRRLFHRRRCARRSRARRSGSGRGEGARVDRRWSRFESAPHPRRRRSAERRRRIGAHRRCSATPALQSSIGAGSLVG